MKDILSNIIVYSIEFIIVYMYFSDLFEKKIKNSFILLIGSFLYLVSGLINVFFDNNIVINTLSFILINFIICILGYDIKISKAILNIVIITSAMIASECIVIFVVSAILHQKITNYQDNFLVFIIDGAISKMLYFIVCKLIVKIKQISNDKNNRTPIYLLLYPLCTIVIFILFRKMAVDYNFSSTLNTGVFLSSIFILIVTIMTYFLYSNTISKEKELIEIKSELDKMEIDKSYYQILEHQNDEMHTFAHNTKNHLQTIKSLANNSEVDKYIECCFGELDKYSLVGKTNNKILDLIINKYNLICEVKNIDFYVIIKTANLDYIPENDLSALLSNILDNAIDAAENSNEKKIELTLNNRNSFDVLTCINSCDNIPKSKEDALITTKKDKRLHGFGTKSIRKISKKHNATYNWKYDEINNEFITTIIFERYKTEPN